METVKATTTDMKLLAFCILLLIYLQVTYGLPTAKTDAQLYQMMHDFLALDDTELMAQASSIPCDDASLPDTCEDYDLFEEPPEFDTSEEPCDDFVPPPLPPLPTARPRPVLPIEHPCFVRLIYLKTPLLKQDPCQNFTLATTPKPAKKKCINKARVASAAMVPNTSTTSTTTTTTTTTSRSTTTTEPSSTEASQNSTTEAEPRSAVEADEDEATITKETTEPTTTTTTTVAATTKKRRGKKQRNMKRKNATVPDKPVIKLDGSTQASEVIQVIANTNQPGELRSGILSDGMMLQKTTTARPLEETTTECIDLPETTTECVEEEEVPNTTTEACEDNDNGYDHNADTEIGDSDNQDTNLCPQYTAPEELVDISARPLRFRKPIKNYVEPILYEGDIAKPRQRIGLVPQKRDYYVSNSKIMTKPKPKYREHVPHSIYMNNIVKGLKCKDGSVVIAETRGRPSPGNLVANLNARHHSNTMGSNVSPPQDPRIWTLRRLPPGFKFSKAQPFIKPTPKPALYTASSIEELFNSQQDNYYDDANSDLLTWPHSTPHSTPPSFDPCQLELSQPPTHSQSYDYGQMAPNFFT